MSEEKDRIRARNSQIRMDELKVEEYNNNKMSKEKLTVDEVLNEIKKHYYQVWIKCNLDTGVNVESLIKTLLEQIRDEVLEKKTQFFDSDRKLNQTVFTNHIDSVFNKYLNNK